MLRYKIYHYGHINVKETAGVYAIVNLINNKKYVGSTSNFRKRYREHYSQLLQEKHVNFHLQNAFNKYGENNFEFWILEECQNVRDTLLFIEQKYINSDGDYNICKIAGKQKGDVYTGHEISDRHRKIIAESNHNRVWSEESRRKLSEASKNSKHNQQQRKIILQYDLNNNFIREFSSITEAAIFLGNINKRVTLKRCCQGKLKTAYKFKWKFKNGNKIN